MKHKILIVHTERGRTTERTLEEVTLRELQRAVGGYIETAHVEGVTKKNLMMLVNEEGLLAGLPVNENLLPFFYVGNCVFVNVVENEDGELDFAGLDECQLRYLDECLSRLSYINAIERG